MSTFYAVFQEPSKARLAVMALLDQGVPTDDISLVAKGDGAVFGKAQPMEASASTHMADASFFVGRDDDPVIDNLIPPQPDPEARFVATEAPIGGGISTGELINDSAETVDQSLDPNWLAEDSIELDGGPTQAERELHDLDLAVETGFPTTPPVIDDFTPDSVPAVDDLERSLETINVPGFGVVIGSGALATAALDYGDGDASDDKDVMMTHFREEGIPDEIASDYLQALDQGRAILAVGLVPGEVEAPLVETVADQFGAQSAATFDAPRF